MLWSPYLLLYGRHDSRGSGPRTSERLVMLLITGATGTIGRPLIDVLVTEDVKVRVGTHRASPPAPQAPTPPPGVGLAGGALSRAAMIAPFLEGVTALFLHPRAV